MRPRGECARVAIGRYSNSQVAPAIIRQFYVCHTNREIPTKFYARTVETSDLEKTIRAPDLPDALRQGARLLQTEPRPAFTMRGSPRRAMRPPPVSSVSARIFLVVRIAGQFSLGM